MATGTWRKLYGTAVIAAMLPGQRRVPFLAREALETMRDRRIRAIVAYAAVNVPHYRELFRREGIDPREITGARDLDRLPFLDRELVRREPRRFLADSSAGRSAIAFTTTGSTGTPAEIHHDRDSLLANIAYGERERDPLIRASGGSFRPKELYVGYETSTIKKVLAFYEDSLLLPLRARRRFVSVLEPIENVAAMANAERPDVLVGYGGWIDLFFKTIAARGIDLHPPKVVMYIGEALPHGARESIEERFGVPVLSRYNAVEAFKIGFTCEERSGFHLHEDLCHVRIVTPNDATAAPGAAGEVVITNLVNRGSVLLNYRLGDVAVMAEGACPCGRTLNRISELEGRVEDIVPLDDGRFVHPRAVWQVFKGDRELLQYQLIQHEPRRFELGLTTVDEPSFRRVLSRSLPRLERLLGPDVMIEPSRRDELDRRQGGKFRAVASLAARRSTSDAQNRARPGGSGS